MLQFNIPRATARRPVLKKIESYDFAALLMMKESGYGIDDGTEDASVTLANKFIYYFGPLPRKIFNALKL